jgi:signal transduction histidine kinase/ligand-binding sensor domain-containing protein
MVGPAHVSRSESTAPRRYVIKVWQGEKGLPQNTITGIAQTADGYLWITTLDGVARFDGVNFIIFKAGDTPTLGSGRIRFLFTGPRDTLWFSTQEGGVIKLEKGRFTPLSLPGAEAAQSAVIQVAEDDARGLWLSTEDGRVSRLVKDACQTISSKWPPADKAGFQVRADARGRLWAMSSSGLYQVAGEDLVPALKGRIGEYNVYCPARAGGWWIEADGQVRLWRDGRWIASAGNPGLAAGSVTCSLESRNGRLWLGTTTNGLFCCSTNGKILHLTKQDGLSSNAERTLFEDSEGNLWAGTEDAGLNQLRLPLFAVYGTPQGFSSDRITSVSRGPEGELWVGTDGCGLHCLQGESVLPAARSDPVSASWRIATVLADHRGRVWVGLRTGGVFRWQNGSFKEVAGLDIAKYSTRSLFEDSHGVIWIGQRNTRTLARVQGDTVSTIELPPSLPQVDVRTMAEDAAGNIWFGTDGMGLLRWKDGQFTRFTRENGFSSDFIWALQPESDGALWMGTYGGGLTRLKNGRAVACTTRHGLVDDVICHIADDGRGQYWFSSNQGIFRVAKSELNQFADGRQTRVQCVAYGKSDGLPVLECEGGCLPAGCSSLDGRLWFPTIRGLVAVDPAEVSADTLAPPVHLESIIVDGKGMEPSASLEIGPGSRRFEFLYTGLNFSAPEMLRFRHKLEGVDAEWVDTGGQRHVSYDQLRHGTYTFRVQACNREGVWNQVGDRITFAVAPYFWQTRWFDASFLLVFGCVVGWTVKYILLQRHNRRLQQLRQLHALEQERTRIARDIHDDLGGSLTEIGYLGALAVRDSQSLADARGQLVRIMDRTRELAKRLDEIVWAVNPKNDSTGHLATYLCQFAKEFFEPTAIQCRLDVASDVADMPLTAEVRHSVFLVVKEAFNNAVKHSAATELWLRLTVSDGVMTIEVSDDGRGFEVGAGREAGNGLRNMAERMAEMGGQFQVQSTPARGATVCLRLPLPPNAQAGDNARHPIQMEDADRAPDV